MRFAVRWWGCSVQDWTPFKIFKRQHALEQIIKKNRIDIAEHKIAPMWASLYIAQQRETSRDNRHRSIKHRPIDIKSLKVSAGELLNRMSPNQENG
jgi:muramidase (phage lysozyme)